MVYACLLGPVGVSMAMTGMPGPQLTCGNPQTEHGPVIPTVVIRE
jgi:hypothetical protein